MYFDQMKTIFENWKISAKILEIQKFDFDKNSFFRLFRVKMARKTPTFSKSKKMLDFGETFHFLPFSSKNCISKKKWF